MINKKKYKYIMTTSFTKESHPISVNYQALQYFRVLARYEHYTKAANSLHITQSALSKSISGLEHDLGLPLFEKSGRGIRLTKSGRILSDYVDRGMHELDSGIERLQEMSCPTVGKIKLAVASYPGNDAIPDLLRGFAERYPDILLKIYQNDSRSIRERLRDGSIDIAICGTLDKANDDDVFTQVELYSHELGLIVPDDSPLAGYDSVTYDDVKEETFIGYNDDVSVTKTILNAIASAGHPPNIHYYISDGYLISGLVRAGLGIGIVPIDSHVHVNGTTLVRLKQPYLEHSYYLTWNHARFMPAAVDTFRNYALSKEWNRMIDKKEAAV